MALTILDPSLMGIDANGASKLTTAGGQLILTSAGIAVIGITSPISTSLATLQVAGTGTKGSLTLARTDVPLSGTSICGIDSYGFDGTQYTVAGTINFRAAENWSSTNHGSDIQFRTTASGSGAALFEAMRITSSGNVGIGTSSPVGKLNVIGGLGLGVALTGDQAVTPPSGSLVLSGINIATEQTYTSPGSSTTLGQIYNYASIANNYFRYLDIASYGSTTGAGSNIRFITGNGTTNAERMRINAAGNVGIGTSAPLRPLEVKGSYATGTILSKNIEGHDFTTTGVSYTRAMGIGVINHNDTTTRTSVTVYSNQWKNPYGAYIGAWVDVDGASDGQSNLVGYMAKLANSGTPNQGAIAFQGDLTSLSDTHGQRYGVYINGEAANYFSGQLLLGTTTSRAGTSSISFEPGNSGIFLRYPGATSLQQVIFARNTDTTVTTAGYISTTGTATTYATASDYRLKENVKPMTGALAKVALLKPVTYTWKSDGSAGEGFIAHELQEVVPHAALGEKDAVNEDGSINPQGIDTSFLVATLTAAIQELDAKFEAYKASHP